MSYNAYAVYCRILERIARRKAEDKRLRSREAQRRYAAKQRERRIEEERFEAEQRKLDVRIRCDMQNTMHQLTRHQERMKRLEEALAKVEEQKAAKKAREAEKNATVTLTIEGIAGNHIFSGLGETLTLTLKRHSCPKTYCMHHLHGLCIHAECIITRRRYTDRDNKVHEIA